MQSQRVRELRKSLNLTMEKFGEPLGVKKSAISNIENGSRNLTDQMIIAICREYNVNEEWLRTGSGEMFVPLTRDEQIEVFIGNVLKDEPGDFRRRLISVLSRLTESEWELLEKKLKEIVGTDEEA